MPDVLEIAASQSAKPIGLGNRGAITIYVDGRPQFMDELELRTDAEVDHILDVYCGLGLNQVCLGPGYANVYDHHDLPPIDWTKQDILPLARKLVSRGLAITLAALPDVPPYFDGTTWRFDLLEVNLKPIYLRLQAEGLISDVREEWEVVTWNQQLVLGVQWLRTIFPSNIPIYYHPPPGHDAPGMSDGEVNPDKSPMTNRQMWENFLAAGGNGLDMQSDPPYSRPDALQAMKDSLWDMRRRATGTDGSPWGGPLLTLQGVPMTVRNAEYSSYDIFHNNLPWSTAVAYGQAGMTVTGPGDDTALDGI